MARKRTSQAVPFRVHFAFADTGERKVADISATSAEEAKAIVQKHRGGCRLIFHKVKVNREASDA